MPSADEIKRILEAGLLAAQEPVTVIELKRLFDQEVGVDVLRKLLEELRAEWSGRAVELVSVASGWRFQTRPEFQPYVERLFPEKAKRLAEETMREVREAMGLSYT